MLEPSEYDPASNAIFKSIDDLGAAIETYNEALRVSPDAARKTFFGKLIIDTGMSPEEYESAGEYPEEKPITVTCPNALCSRVTTRAR